MKEWIKQKLSDYTSRKFIAFIITEICMVKLILAGMITDSWSIIAGVLIPYILYEYLNGALTLKDLQISTDIIKLNTKDESK